MSWKAPSHERMQEVLHGPFDIETHKQTFVSYLEVVISPEGVVEYATPSHTEKMIEIFAKQKGFDDIDKAREYVWDVTVKNGMCSAVEYLSGVTGYIVVWFDHYYASDPPTKAQLDKLWELFKNGVYAGPTHDIVTPKKLALEQYLESVKARIRKDE
jgi:hypothetical protein